MTRKDPKDVEKARIAADADSKRYAGCCEACDTPEDCRAGRVPCVLSGELMTEQNPNDADMLAMATTFEVYDDPKARRTIRVDARKQRDGPTLWVIIDDIRNVWNKLGEWEYEPQPSSRDDEFIARTRWPDARTAIIESRRAINA